MNSMSGFVVVHRYLEDTDDHIGPERYLNLATVAVMSTTGQYLDHTRIRFIHPDMPDIRVVESPSDIMAMHGVTPREL